MSVLHEFIAMNREAIVRRCQETAATRSVSGLTEAEADRGIPLFLDQLVETLRLNLTSSAAIDSSAAQHGHDLLQHGFTVAHVVHEYGDVCQAITELAMQSPTLIRTEEFRALNRCLDDAIAGAVTAHGRVRHPSRRRGDTAAGGEELGYLAHELRNLINTAILAFDVLKTGNVGVAGSTGAVLHRSLIGLRAVVGRSLADVRLTHGVQHPEPFLVSGFIEEITPAATLEASTRGIGLIVMPVEDGVIIEADRQVLAAVVSNVLQNAVKFTRPRSTITLRVRASLADVFIEIQDECGGLPGGNVVDLFLPFTQQGSERTGLGLGLAFSRRGVEANHGQIYARDLPERGCVFTIELPRVQFSALVRHDDGHVSRPGRHLLRRTT